MFKKHVITSLVALGLFATTISPAFAEDTSTGSADAATTGTTTTDAATTGTTTTDAATTDAATTNTATTDQGATVGTDTDTSVGTTTSDKEKPGRKDKKNKMGDIEKDKKVDLVCMQTAVEKRDNAVIVALDTSYTNVKTALTARRDAVKAAWGIEDRSARKDAIRKAWKDFQGTWKKEKKALNMAKKAAWKQFKGDKRACGGEGEGESESEGGDIKL